MPIYFTYINKNSTNRKITQWIEFQNQLPCHFVYPAAFYQILKLFVHFWQKKKKKISRSFSLSFRPLSSYFTYFRFLLIYTHTRTHMDRGNIYRGNQLSLLHIDSANVCQRLNTRAIRGFPLAHESSTFNSESVGLFFFFFPPLESSPEAVPWMEKPRIFPGGLVSLDEKPCNPSRHLWFVRLFSFVYARLYSSSLELPGFISPPFFFRCWRCWHAWRRHQKEPRGNVFEAKKLCKNLSVFVLPPPPPPSSSPFHFIRAYVFWIFGSLKSKLKFSSELRLKFRMFRYDSKLVEDLND